LGISFPTIKRIEQTKDEAPGRKRTVDSICQDIEAAGIDFTDGRPGRAAQRTAALTR
jgi:hypothetical protein